jgi:hypothetical protein
MSKLPKTSSSFAPRAFRWTRRDGAVEGRHAVLELGQVIGDVGGQQIAARRQRLTEFDEDRSQFLERQRSRSPRVTPMLR